MPLDQTLEYAYYMYMPTVLTVKNLLFIIHTRDHGHPHVTVYQGKPENFEAMAKIRLDVIEVIESKGFSARALNTLISITVTNQEHFLEQWEFYHGNE